MNTLKNVALITTITSLMVVSFLYVGTRTKGADAGNAGNLPARVGSSSPITLGLNATSTLAEPVRSCSSRTISTGQNPVMLAFEADGDVAINGVASSTNGSNQALSSVYGIWQAASTTVNYPAEDYGCGWVTGLGVNGATSNLSIFEAY